MALKELIATFGIEVDASAITAAEKKVNSFTSGLKQFAVGVATYFVSKGIVEMVGGVADAGDALDEMSTKLGVGRKDLQEWQYVAKMAGVDSGELGQAFGILQKNAFEAANGSQSMADAFAKLGVEVKGPNGEMRAGADIMADVADGLDGLKDKNAKTAMAMSVLGKSGKDLIPLFAGGSAAIREQQKELGALGGLLSDDLIDASVKYSDNNDRLTAGFTGLKNLIAEALMPAFMWVQEALISGIKWFQKLAKETALVRGVLMGLGAVLAGLGIAFAIAGSTAIAAFLPIIGTAILIGAAISAVVLIVDELIVTFQGGDSYLKDFIDSMFGLGATKSVVQGIKDYFSDLVLVIREAADVLEPLIKAVGTFFSLKNTNESMFGKEKRAQILARMDGVAPAIASGSGGFSAQSFAAPMRSVAAPMSSSVANQSSYSTANNITVNAAPGMSEIQVAKAVRQEIEDADRRRRGDLRGAIPDGRR